MVEYHVQVKLTPILCDFCQFWPKFGSHSNVRYTFAIRNLFPIFLPRKPSCI